MNDDDMSNTFVGEVGQKSAIFKDDDIETLDEEVKEQPKEDLFPEVKIDPPTEIPTTLKDANEKEINEEPKEDKVDEDFLEDIKKPKKNKKGHPFLTFIFMLICLALGAGGSYYYFEIYNKPVEKPKEKEPVQENVEQIQPSSRFVNKLVDKYYNDFDSIESYTELYAKDSMTVADFSNEYTQKLGALNIKNSNSFKNESLQNSLDELFGANKTQVEKENIEYNKCYIYKYNDDEYTLNISGTCNDAKTYDVITKIVKAEKDKTKDELYVNVAVAVTDGNKMYKSYAEDTKSGKDEIVDLSYSSFDMDKDYTKFNQYKYTFKYDKDNNDYYLVSIELNK